MLDEVDVELVIGNKPEPMLHLSKALSFGGLNRRTVGLFSSTTKMNAASLSLPAGPPSVGGTCPSSAAIPEGSAEGEWVCHGCYATTGNFRFSNVQAAQAIRLKWVRKALRGGTFVSGMVRAIERYRMAPCAGGTFLNPAFFRIHDSGDFFSAEYARAWVAIAERLPGMFFWAPTREWIFSAKLPSLQNAPPNLSIRPSALFVDDLPPKVDGMAAGSSVMRRPPAAVWDCPAYHSESKSCESAGCRTCWTRQAVEVNYNPHGGIKKLSPDERVAARSRRPRANPSLPSLSAEWKRHLARRRPEWTEPGAPSLHNFWISLNQRHFRATDFSEEAWFALFRAQGIKSVERQTALLETMLFDLS